MGKLHRELNQQARSYNHDCTEPNEELDLIRTSKCLIPADFPRTLEELNGLSGMSFSTLIFHFDSPT